MEVETTTPTFAPNLFIKFNNQTSKSFSLTQNDSILSTIKPTISTLFRHISLKKDKNYYRASFKLTNQSDQQEFYNLGVLITKLPNGVKLDFLFSDNNNQPITAGTPFVELDATKESVDFYIELILKGTNLEGSTININYTVSTELETETETVKGT